MLITISVPGPDSKEQYKNLSYFSRGGMGEIYKAHDEINAKEVAIKLIPIVDPDEEKLLARELEISSELEDDNIVAECVKKRETVSSQV